MKRMNPEKAEDETPLCKQREFKSRLHDTQRLRVTLKQWRIFQAVVDYGGFNLAASNLYLSQSTVSYSIAKLEKMLGVQLLEVEGRRSRLTAAGKEIYNMSRYILRAAGEVEEMAKHLAASDQCKMKPDFDNAAYHTLATALHRQVILKRGQGHAAGKHCSARSTEH